ncbi:amino acid permease [Streptomyces sp. NPDC048723]|uniref:amino acid permease n=1 Tax=Streptomyces sp. NPDC048723 TaxID=3365589 RepID=UPI003719F9D6
MPHRPCQLVLRGTPLLHRQHCLNHRTPWASRLANPRVGWWFGWLTFCYLAIGVVTVDNTLVSQALMPLAGIAPHESTARLITLVVLLVQTVPAVASTRLVSLINTVTVGLSLALVVVVAVALVIAALLTFDRQALETEPGKVNSFTREAFTREPPKTLTDRIDAAVRSR